MLALFVAVLAAVVLARPVYAIVRFIRLPGAAKRNYPAALRARLRWRWLTRNLGLAYLDQHRRSVSPVKLGTSVKVSAAAPVAARLRYPRARFRPDGFGIVARVKTVPRVGRGEFDSQAEHIANAWNCHRVQVHQEKPGRLLIRGLRTDPLTLPFEAPEEVFGATSVQGPEIRPGATDLSLYAGCDEWGDDRWFPLYGLTGITVGGLPDFGKTTLVNSFLCQLAGLDCVQFVIIDGKGGGDYEDWRDRAFIFVGDELPAAAVALEDTHGLMRSRLGSVLERTGHKNAWRAGPSPAFPLIVTVIDECHTFFDLDGVKGRQADEKLVRACRTLTGQLVRKGRSVLFLTVLVTQKQTSDAIPTFLRDNCRPGFSFAVKTRDAAVAGLGEHIREYPSYCPTTLQDPAYVGVMTASLRTGHDPFVRIRVPDLDEAAVAARAAETACKRSDPRAIPSPVPVPASVPERVPERV
jgi:S-DNA-T family DNA segregation ATPase FtsK/SpoIIIE